MLLLIPFGAKIRPLYSKFHYDPVYQSTIFTITIPFIVDFLFQSTISKNMCVKCSLVFLPAVFNFRPKPVFMTLKIVLSPFQLQITASIHERQLRVAWARIAAAVRKPTLLFVTDRGFLQYSMYSIFPQKPVFMALKVS